MTAAAHVFLAPVPATAGASGDARPELRQASQVEGVLTEAGVACPQFQTMDGKTISLMGKVPSQYGSAFRLHGQWARISTCMQGETFNVTDFQEVEHTP